ncbi:hypothetical protein CIHG_02560 [Coccidioides immitis H538.4]|uniref:Uncharacterized protein n=1 Tax=Coccidioides immitis H538.4 TaxID=396776 RepID=A0A0J8RIV9_COCIT|nr:hypothetical protein CIHG_02560 [Coccidioides immitis H538.4]
MTSHDVAAAARSNGEAQARLDLGAVQEAGWKLSLKECRAVSALIPAMRWIAFLE